MRVFARRFALLTALSTMFALFVVGTASATHGAGTLNVVNVGDATPADDSDTNVAGSALHTLSATLSIAAGTPISIDFEIESGPSDTDGNTPTTPDLECSIAVTLTSCTVSFVSLVPGTDVVRGWIDEDGNDATVDGTTDLTEGVDEVADPGSDGEQDFTDVVEKIWTAGEARNIDLAPDTATNPSGTIHKVVASVTDVDGLPAEGVVVTFTEDGTGRFAFNADDEFPTAQPGQQVSTDENGEAATFTETFPGEEGDQEITGELQAVAGPPFGNTDCELAVNVPPGATAGNCDETVTKTWGPGVVSDCTITGTEGDDVLEGTDGDDVICGLAGNDSITGLAGNDTLKGGQGNDTAKGGTGNDLVRGGAGDDSLRGGPGNDTVKGGGGNDNLKGGSGNDALRGGKGTDFCKGGPGTDSIKGCEN